MKEIAVIGLNNYGMEIARALSLSGFSILVADKDHLRINRIEPEVQQVQLINDWDVSQIKTINFFRFERILLIMGEKLDLALVCATHLKELEIKNVILCPENEDQETVAEMFMGDMTWKIIRTDKLVAESIRKIV